MPQPSSSKVSSPTSIASLHWHYTELNDKDFQIKGRTLFFILTLFAVVFLVALIYFYVQRLCRRRRHTSISHAPLSLPCSRPRGLDKASISALPVTLHSEQKDKGEGECCICLGVFEDSDRVKVLPRCLHCYHGDCVDKWLMTQSSCPLCRSSLRVHSSSV
ncbi:hypothetical protein ACFE04_031063 [Oxalis oulophora]